jgi:hypothetical protein
MQRGMTDTAYIEPAIEHYWVQTPFLTNKKERQTCFDSPGASHKHFCTDCFCDMLDYKNTGPTKAIVQPLKLDHLKITPEIEQFSLHPQYYWLYI